MHEVYLCIHWMTFCLPENMSNMRAHSVGACALAAAAGGGGPCCVFFPSFSPISSGVLAQTVCPSERASYERDVGPYIYSYMYLCTNASSAAASTAAADVHHERSKRSDKQASWVERKFNCSGADTISDGVFTARRIRRCCLCIAIAQRHTKI